MANEINTTDQWTGEIISYTPAAIKAGDPIKMRVSWCAQKTGLTGFKTWIVARVGDRQAKSYIVDAFGNYTFIDIDKKLGLIQDLGTMPNNTIIGTLELWTSHVFGINSSIQDKKSFVINPAGSATPDTQADIDAQNAQAQQQTGAPAITAAAAAAAAIIDATIANTSGAATSGLSDGLKYAFYLVIAIIAAYLIFMAVRYVK
jgi:hypothetical protein